MTELPFPWHVVDASEIADVFLGKTPTAKAYRDTGTHKIIKFRDVKNDGTIDFSTGKAGFVDPADADRLALKETKVGDVLITASAHSPEHIGRKVALFLGLPDQFDKAYAVGELLILRPHADIDPKWLSYFIRSEAGYRAIQDRVYGMHLVASRAQSIQFPICSSNEQRRIVAKLDALFERSRNIRDKLDRIPTLLDKLRKSILAAAMSGALTREWRDAHPHLAVWTDGAIENVSTVGTGSTPLRSNSAFYAETGTPWITSAATGEPYVTESREFVTTEAIAAHRLKLYPIGTLLVAMYGEGKTRGQVTELSIEATINQACAAVVVDESKADRRYIKLALQAKYLEMRALAKGGNQPNLNLSKIKQLPVRLPSLEEQVEIVLRAEAMLRQISSLEAIASGQSNRQEMLNSILLNKAFRGELVPQDPDDEPASVLLERIRAEREASGEAQRVRGRRKNS